MRYGIAIFFALFFSFSLHAIPDLPDELRLVQTFDIETQLLGTESQTVFAANGALATSRNGENEVYIWDVATGEIILKLIGDPSGAFYWSAMSMSADARFLALAFNNGILIYEIDALIAISQNGDSGRG